MRDINKYSKDYINLPFEDIQVEFRRKKVIDILEFYKPKRILEVGCGMDSLVNYYKKFKYFSIIEPSNKFFKKAKKDISKLENVFIFKGFLEESYINFKNEDFDFIIISSLLHELNNQELFLLRLKEICTQNTVIHFNVPNAKSFHRILAYEMGIINSIYDKSNVQNTMQQNNKVFDISSLKILLQSNNFEILDSGSYFVKPFTHEQMKLILDSKVFPDQLLSGLDKMTKYFQGFGSEIYVNAKLKS